MATELESSEKDIAVKHKANHSEGFRLPFLPFDPLFVWMTLIYCITRIAEWVTGTERFWERTWHAFVDWTDVDEYDFVVWAIPFSMMTLFWSLSIGCCILDLTGIAKKYKVQPGTNDPLDMVVVMKALVTVIFNQTVVSLTFDGTAFWISRALLGERDVKECSSFPVLMRDLLVSHLIFDILFYIFHRAMHSKYFYKRIHKIHHEWRAPIGVISIYTHPTEHLITNLLPAIAGPVVTVTNTSTIFVWFACIGISTISDHSGYHFPFLKSSEFHDNHHVNFTECFGTCGFMDWVFGTDKRFKRSIHYKRHRVLMTFKRSARELYQKTNVKAAEFENEERIIDGK